jgi:hypothetical protein
MDSQQSLKRVLTVGNRYPRQIALLRVGIGIYLLILTAALEGAGHLGQWGWLLVGTAVLHFGLAYRLFRIATKDPHPA